MKPDGVAILAGIIPLKSAKMGAWLNGNVPGIRVPDALLEEMQSVAGTDGEIAKGVDIAARTIRDIQKLCAGVHVMALGWEAHIPAILEASGLRRAYCVSSFAEGCGGFAGQLAEEPREVGRVGEAQVVGSLRDRHVRVGQVALGLEQQALLQHARRSFTGDLQTGGAQRAGVTFNDLRILGLPTNRCAGEFRFFSRSRATSAARALLAADGKFRRLMERPHSTDQ